MTIEKLVKPELSYNKQTSILRITPKKNPEYNGLCRVNILAASNYRDASLHIENLGRIGAIPDSKSDDIRPIEFLVKGKGKQTFKIMDRDVTSYYLEFTFVL
jgi:hypothetical protein